MSGGPGLRGGAVSQDLRCLRAMRVCAGTGVESAWARRLGHRQKVLRFAWPCQARGLFTHVQDAQQSQMGQAFRQQKLSGDCT